METLTLDAGAPYKHLSHHVMPRSQHEKRVIAFHMRQYAKPGPYNLHGVSFLHSFASKKLKCLLLFLKHNMELALCAQEVCNRAALLLKQLNLQRKKDQFCDCVLRQKDSPGRLHPAHRCVLAASSPVLASIMSSTGVLVELQAPCMSDRVLEALLDYVYTRSLPHTQSQQQHHSLLIAASYLQMEELMEALQTWQQTKRKCVDDADAPADDEMQMNEDIDTENVKASTPNVPFSKVSDISNVNEKVQKDPSLDLVTSGVLQRRAEDEPVAMNEDRRASSFAPSCCEAVPVICHSSDMAVLRMAEASALPLRQPMSQASLSGAAVLRSANRDADATVEGNAPDERNQREALIEKSQRENVKPTMAQGPYHVDELNQSEAEETRYEPTAKRCHQFKRDYSSLGISSHYNPLNIQHPCFDPLQTTDTTDNPLLQNKEADVSVYDSPSKYKRVKRCEGFSISSRAATKEPSADLRAAAAAAAASPPEGSSDSHCEDFCPEGGVKEEHSYSSSCQGEPDVQDSQCNVYGPKKKWLSNICWAAAGMKDAAAVRHEKVSEETQAAAGNRGTTVWSVPVSTTPGSSLDNITGRPSFERHTSVEPEKTIAGQRSTFPVSVDSSLSDALCRGVSQSYTGLVHYHCLTEEDAPCDHKHSRYSDRSGDEEADATFAGAGLDPSAHHCAAENTDQFLLLDISTKPAELLVSYRHASDGEEEEEGGARCQRGRFETWRAGVERCRPGAEVSPRAAAPCPEEAENRIGTWTVCSPPCVSDSVAAPMPPASSVGMPSGLSDNMPTNVSTPLSPLVSHPFQCTLCDRSFSQRGSLNRHVRSHLGVRPFPCPHCPMTFSRQYRVTEHMRVHQRCVLRNDFQPPP